MGWMVLPFTPERLITLLRNTDMTMHLLNVREPVKKQKAKVTQAKRLQWDQEHSDHNRYLKSIGLSTITLQQFIDQKHGRKASKTVARTTLQPQPRVHRTTQHIPSHSFDGGVCAKPAPKVYTGTAVLGVSTMHKSNSVPVFSQQEAIEIATMRRG